MTILESVKSMQQQGVPESEIISTLQQQGIPYREISDALSQSKIKAAVEQPSSDPQQTQTDQLSPPGVAGGVFPDSPDQSSIQAPSPSDQQQPQESQNPQTQGMQKSILQTGSPQYQGNENFNEQSIPEYNYDPSGQSPYSGYGDQYGYDYTSSAMSPDTITEISEQVVSEKLVDLRKKLENVINFKTTFETKAEAMDERIKRIEKILDNLQSSVLRKVGNYVNDVSDIKKELIETQKSFSKLAPGFKTKSSQNHEKKRKKTSKKSKKK